MPGVDPSKLDYAEVQIQLQILEHIAQKGPLTPSHSGAREKLQHVAVGIFEIYATAAVPGIGFHVILREWTAAVRDSGLLDATEDRIELRIADVEGIVMDLEAIPVVEIQGECFVDLDGCKNGSSRHRTSGRISGRKTLPTPPCHAPARSCDSA